MYKSIWYCEEEIREKSLCELEGSSMISIQKAKEIRNKWIVTVKKF